MKESWAKNTARIARSVTGCDRNKFQNNQLQHHFERHVSVQRVAHELISNAEDLRHKPAHESDQQSARYWLEPDHLLREPQEARPQSQQKLCEGHRNQTAGHAGHRINLYLLGA